MVSVLTHNELILSCGMAIWTIENTMDTLILKVHKHSLPLHKRFVALGTLHFSKFAMSYKMIGDPPYFTLHSHPTLATEHFEIFHDPVSLLVSETRKGCYTHRESQEASTLTLVTLSMKVYVRNTH